MTGGGVAAAVAAVAMGIGAAAAAAAAMVDSYLAEATAAARRDTLVNAWEIVNGASWGGRKVRARWVAKEERCRRDGIWRSGYKSNARVQSNGMMIVEKNTECVGWKSETEKKKEFNNFFAMAEGLERSARVARARCIFLHRYTNTMNKKTV